MTDAYDKIDRFLRNNLDDSDYAEYSAALEEVFTEPAASEAIESRLSEAPLHSLDATNER